MNGSTTDRIASSQKGVQERIAAPKSHTRALWASRNAPGVLATGALIGATLGVLAPASATLAILLVILCVAALIDLRTGLIPNVLTLAATAFALIGWLVAPPLEIAPVAAALAAAGLLGVLRAGSTQWLSAPGFGLGDIKLVIPMGLVLGWSVIWSLYLAVALAAIVGIVGLGTGRLTRRSRLPFAPFMLAGVLLCFVMPFERVLDWFAALPV